MESREVKIRVDLDMADAATAADTPVRPQPENPGTVPPAPGIPVPDAGAGQGRVPHEAVPGGAPPPAPGPNAPGGPGAGPGHDVPGRGRGTNDEQVEQRITDRLRQELGTAASSATGGGGRLSEQAIGLSAAALGSVPVIGGALAGGVRIAEFAERYGAAAMTAAAEAMAKSNPKFAEGLKAAAEAAETGTRFTAGVRARLDAVGQAFEETRQVAGGIVLMGGEPDGAALSEFGINRYGIVRTMLEAEAGRRTRSLEALGAAGGHLLGELLSRSFGDAGR